MFERLNSVGMQPHVNKFTDTQIASRMTWARVPNEQVANYAMHIVRVVPKNASTETTVNPIDPDGDGYVCPSDQSFGPVARTGIWQGY